jgi:alpha-amylase
MQKRRIFLPLIVLVMILLYPLGSTTNAYDRYRTENQFNNYSQQSVLGKTSSTPGNKVMLQSYYWLVPDNGEWWNILNNYAHEFSEVGFDSLWLPPPSKTAEGDTAAGGYEPFDYYDLGEFNQKGRIETRYGSRAELESLISELLAYDLAPIADIVINHNNGGESEFNPFAGGETDTNFENIESGKFPRNYTCFYPCDYGIEDTLKFGAMPDLCHLNPYVHDELIEWGKWLRDDIGFTGWRFDVARGFIHTMIEDWMTEVGGWGVSEYWDGTPDMAASEFVTFLDQIDNATMIFDFPLLDHLRSMAVLEGVYDMRNLENAGVLGVRKNQSITFVSNHDTVRVQELKLTKNKHLAYAYILTHEGYPMVFWADYFDIDLQPHIKTLTEIHNTFAKGDTSILHTDDDLYLAQRNGNPGLIIGLNDNPTEWKEAEVQTKWTSVTLHDLTGQVPDVDVDANGEATISIPPLGYAVYSNHEPLASLYGPPDLDNQPITGTIQLQNISVDGQLDREWAQPIFSDSRTDAGGSITDLSNLYIKHNNTHLFIGFGFEAGTWKRADVHYGIAFDVKDGGTRLDPGLHPKINWAGDNLPDHLIYLQTDSESTFNDIIQSAKMYSYDPETARWNQGTDVDNSAFASNGELNFAEIQIPLTSIELENGGNLSLMIFSTEDGKPGAADSIPNDRYTDGVGDADSWLTLTTVLELRTDKKSTTTTSKTSGLSEFTLLVVISLGLISQLFRKRR